MSYVVVSVSDPDYDDEYKGKLLLCFEVEVQPAAQQVSRSFATAVIVLHFRYLEYARLRARSQSRLRPLSTLRTTKTFIAVASRGARCTISPTFEHACR
jgi:hypothetical protein